MDSRQGIGRSLIGTLITLSGAALWGLNAVASKYLMSRGIDAMWMVNFRMIVSGAILVLVGIVRDRGRMFDIWRDRRSALRLLVIAAFAFGACQPTYYLSINYSNAGIASALQQTAPVFVLIYVMISERRKPSAAELVTIPMVVAGAFLIATHGDLRSLAIHPVALASGLCSALMSALYITLPAPLIRRYGTLATVGWGLFAGGILISPICGLANFPPIIDASLVLGLAFIIVPGAAMAFGLFLYGTSIVGPVRGGVYNLFEPVTAALASYICLGQIFYPSELAGMVLILAGIAIMTIKKGGK